MALDHNQINRLLDISMPSDSSDRVFLIEDTNLMTAIKWFKKITGVDLTLQQLVSTRASGGFFLFTHKAGGNNVTIRGGSSSPVKSVRDVYIFSSDYQQLAHDSFESTMPGVPTLDITNPNQLQGVPRIATCQGRVEFKFVTRYEYVSNR